MKGKRLFQNKLIVLGVIALLIVGLVLPFPNFKHKVQVNAARERITSEVTDSDLLALYNQLDNGGWSTIYLSPNSMWEPRRVDGNGDMHTDDGGVRFASINFSQVGLTSKISIYVNGTPQSGTDVGVSQSINTIAGHRYQISYKGSYSGAGSFNPVGRSAIDVLDSTDLNAGTSLLPPGANSPVSDQNMLQRTTFTGTGERVMIRATVQPYRTYTFVTFSGLSVVDLDQGVEEARVGIEKLFRDETHTKLNYSVIQSDINNVQGQIHLILDPVLKQKYQTELDKAQRLMDGSKPNFTIEQLVDNPNDEHSSTIIGKADPGAMLRFTGSTSLPNPALASDNPRNSIMYSVKADEDGNFRFKLPAGNYFKAGEKISIYSTLYGKSVSGSEVVIDTTPPDPPVFQKLADRDKNFVGTAEANSMVEIFDASKKKSRQAVLMQMGIFLFQFHGASCRLFLIQNIQQRVQIVLGT